VTIGPGGLVPILILGGLFAVVGFKVGLPMVLAGALGATAGTGSLLVHEFGHVLAARGLRGVRPAGVSLVWLGAGTRFEGAYRSARDQVRVAAAGPLASICTSAALLSMMFAPIPGTARKLLLMLVLFNLALAVVNLIPVSPLDGHRILRGLLWAFFGSETAARHAIGRMARVWIGLELVGTGAVLVERPALGLGMAIAGVSLVGQRLVARPARG
jgi:Zn-dependent protease